MIRYLLIFVSIISSFAWSFTPVSGSKTAYYYDNTLKVTPAPKGYTPFYIDHVGRHGSRFLSKPNELILVQHRLQMADEKQELTIMGKDLLKQIDRLVKLNQNHYGQLTDLGRLQMQEIGQRMLNNYPEVFTGQGLSVLSSHSPRAVESAENFLKPFLIKYPLVNITQQNENAQTLMRFFEYSPVYLEYKESTVIKQSRRLLENSQLMLDVSLHITKRIFDDNVIDKLQKSTPDNKEQTKLTEFVLAFFSLYQELLSLTPTMLTDNQLDLSPYFSDSEREWLTTVSSAKNYLQIGPAFNPNGIQIKIAAPLLWDMLTTAETAILNQTTDANLRFGHAETISPLATLLELEGTADVADTINDYPLVWQEDNIVPMAANIQFIFYRSEQRDAPILVKVLLNEREVHLPLYTTSYPYYVWDDIKHFYERKLDRIEFPKSDDVLMQLNTLY